jgi:uncharacterized membrane protein
MANRYGNVDKGVISSPAIDSGMAPLKLRSISPEDIRVVLAKGLDDFWEKPSHLVFLGIIYPLAGIVLGRLAIGYEVLPLLFPLIAGFALVGPFAAIGLYEISRRREQGLDTSWVHALDVLQSPSRGAILELGSIQMVIYFAWLVTAMLLYQVTFGDSYPASITGFLQEVFTTPHGWALIILGNIIGFLFAVVVLTISVVSFPMLVDRNVNVGTAVKTSIKAVVANPVTMGLWGLVVAAGLIVGCLTLFVGLAVVMPILGHATWHLYRKVVED